jgi:hypothetical protein
MDIAATPPTNSRKVAGAKAHTRSRISNGRDILPGVDQRSRIARRYRDLVAEITADQGGADLCSESRKQLIRRFAAASCIAESFEAKLVAGGEINLAEFAQLSSTLVRLTNHLGLARVPRVVNGLVGEVIDGELSPRQFASPMRDNLSGEDA